MNDDPMILKEYDDLLFLYKPPFWDCHVQGENILHFVNTTNRKQMLVKWVFDNLSLDDSLLNCKVCRLGMVNRIDKETSGIVLFAKTASSFSKYRKIINDHSKTTKIYIALVNGMLSQTFGVITLPLLHNDYNNRTNVDVKNGHFTYTEYITLRSYELDNNFYTLVLIKIKTGMTHQIRAHFKKLGHVLFCDKFYNDDIKHLNNEEKLLNRLFLHSLFYKVNNNMKAFSSIPRDLIDLLKIMKLTHKFFSIKNALKILLKNNYITVFTKYNN